MKKHLAAALRRLATRLDGPMVIAVNIQGSAPTTANAIASEIKWGTGRG